MGSPEARASFAQDIALLQAANINVVVVSFTDFLDHLSAIADSPFIGYEVGARWWTHDRGLA
jgi:hypothetical protein